MRWSSDRTGFPVLELPEINLAAHLLPIVKRQFECFLAEPQPGPLHGDAWYEEVLAASPRLGLREATIDTYEGLLLGGMLPEDVGPFARWLGSGYDLPTVDMWRRFDAALNDRELTAEQGVSLRDDDRWSKPARAILGWWLQRRQPRTWSELAMLRGGLLEWVRVGSRQYGGLGRPRPAFRMLLINPQRDEPLRPIQNRRLASFGVRLMRPL